jgi:DNA polymerase III, delta subunit
MEFATNHPAHLVIGHHQMLTVHIEHYLQKTLCPKRGCTYCMSCRQIRERQHASVFWVIPDKQYTLEIIAPVLDLVALKRNIQEPCYVVLSHADFLTAACANMLLKCMEEPSPGYYFILTAARAQSVLPTIRSRCMIHIIKTTTQIVSHDFLLDHFTQKNPLSPLAFFSMLEASTITERESVELIDAITEYWHDALRTSIIQRDKELSTRAEHMVVILARATQETPMPGSSKLFWKNLFLQVLTFP